MTNSVEPAPKLAWEEPSYQRLQQRRFEVVRPSGAIAPLVPERICFYCSDPATTRDHVIPRAKGGRKTAENRVDACFSCNQIKADLTLEEFYVQFRKRVARQWFAVYANLGEGPSTCQACGWRVRHRRNGAPRSDWHHGLETISTKVPRCPECGFEMVNEQRFFPARRRHNDPYRD